MNGSEYTTISQVQNYTYSPWASKVLLNGTDGLQFSPDLSSDDTLFTFAPDLNRNLYFTYKSTNDSYYNLDTYMYYVSDEVLQNSTDNANYEIDISGTTNLTTTMNAYAFAAKGHYYGIDDKASDSKPQLFDSSMSEIEASADNDNTYLGVEKLSGVSLISMERIFYNMVIYGDNLFQNFVPEIPSEYGYFFPLAFKSREMSWSDDQVSDTFGSFIRLQKCKWIFLSLLLFFGVLALALSVFYGLKYRRLRSQLPSTAPELDDEEEQEAAA